MRYLLCALKVLILVSALVILVNKSKIVHSSESLTSWFMVILYSTSTGKLDNSPQCSSIKDQLLTL